MSQPNPKGGSEANTPARRLANPQRLRLRRRLYQHHASILIASTVSIYLLFITRPYTDMLSKLSFATAYPALVLLVVTLLIGPWNTVAAKRVPVSSDLRRDFGIWAGILGLFHAAIGQNVHLRGRPWLYYVYEHHRNGPSGVRHDLFGIANLTGLIATVILLLLFVTSNDYSLRALGTPRWKQIQRWNYVCFGLTGIHAIGYQTIEKQQMGFVIAASGCLSLTLILQCTGFYLRRRQSRLSLVQA